MNARSVHLPSLTAQVLGFQHLPGSAALADTTTQSFPCPVADNPDRRAIIPIYSTGTEQTQADPKVFGALLNRDHVVLTHEMGSL